MRRPNHCIPEARERTSWVGILPASLLSIQMDLLLYLDKFSASFVSIGTIAFDLGRDTDMKAGQAIIPNGTLSMKH